MLRKSYSLKGILRATSVLYLQTPPRPGGEMPKENTNPTYPTWDNTQAREKHEGLSTPVLPKEYYYDMDEVSDLKSFGNAVSIFMGLFMMYLYFRIILDPFNEGGLKWSAVGDFPLMQGPASFQSKKLPGSDAAESWGHGVYAERLHKPPTS